jgi:hypothetical protein
MVNYKVQATGDWAPTPSVTQPEVESGYVHSTYEVVEVGTHQIIKSDITKEEAKTLCRHLNFGGGFDGWTPAFFTQKNNYSDVGNIFFV